MSGHDRARRAVRLVVGTGSIVVLSICVATAAWAHGSAHHGSHGAAKSAPACSAGSLYATLDLTAKGGSLDSKAGAIVFTLIPETGGESCSLTGVPTISVESATTGASLGVYEEKSIHRHANAVVLPGRAAAVSVTWSDWTCVTGTYSLAVTFPGWPHPLVVPSSSVPGTLACTGNGQTIYVGPVAPTAH